MLHDTIRDELKVAMKAKDEVALRTIRGMLTGFTNELVTKGRKPTEQLTDEEVLAVIKRQVKQRKDSIAQFTAGNRPDLAQTEQQELVILEKYLPAMMGHDEIRPVIKAKMAELGITAATEKNKLMGVVMKELGGRADGNDVRVLVDEAFS